MSKIAHAQFDCNEGCSVEYALSQIAGKYKGTILYRLLSDQTLRFNQLFKLFPEISQKTLTNQLRSLERDGLIIRTIYPEMPPKVEYQLSEKGRTLAPILNELKAWGDCYKTKTAL
ncbi:helix-turn-helix transcriptional regulator [Pasteurellaceae bacterium HPA106]|uniref:winged helix-turn-helix transcriptional regulator n=1 Tax=Spirabiliibacterium pneumoniae TaxID=221400 RepID=UPI001AAD99CD|nr:helix-turn-helix domain-containing protein [Spirabiliibacterium pneumoniae]MBE2895971.1 helix-turn-helix transcriptional regulator [Spirabiliibacterium pneumoniae]